MFLCAECIGTKEPLVGFISHGRCEGCGKTRDCKDVHHSLLPIKKEAKDG